MDCVLETIGEMTLLGMERRFHYDNSFTEIPKYWDEYERQGYADTVPGMLGVCFDGGKEPTFTYLIGDFCTPDATVPKGFTKRAVPPCTWAKFRAVGAIPETLQRLNRRVYAEWLPDHPEYELAGGMNIEVYTQGDMQSPDYVSEIWVPVRKK